MPQEVKDNLLKSTSQGEPGGISIMAANAYPGSYTSDTAYSAHLGNSAGNVVYSYCDSDGFFADGVYHKFQGYGYTGWTGSGTPAAGNIKATANVRAVGLVPLIAIGSTTVWSPLTTSKQVGYDQNTSGYKYAKANYSNVKVQSLTGITTIFSNTSYIKLPSGANDTWSEDTYWWF